METLESSEKTPSGNKTFRRCTELDIKLIKRLQEEFPWFPKKDPLWRADMNVPMHVDTDDGWFDLIHKLCKSIQKELETNHPNPEQFAVDQVKEKFGGLRFYVSGSTSTIHRLIDEASAKSYHTCEVCGKKASLMVAGGWYKTICKKCTKKDKEREWVPVEERFHSKGITVSLVKRAEIEEANDHGN